MMLAMEPVTFLKMVFEGGPVVACVALAITVVWTMRRRVKGEVKSQINQLNKDHAKELQTLKVQTASLTRIEETLKIVGNRVNHHLGTVDNTSVRKAAIRGTVLSNGMKKTLDALEKDYDGGWLGQCIAALDDAGPMSRAADDILKRLPALETVVEDMDKFLRDRLQLVLDNQSHDFTTMNKQFAMLKDREDVVDRATMSVLARIRDDADCAVGMLKLEQRLVSPYDMQAALYAADMRQKLDEFFKAAPNQEMTTNVDLDGAWAEIIIRENGFHVDVHLDQDDELPAEGSVPCQVVTQDDEPTGGNPVQDRYTGEVVDHDPFSGDDTVVQPVGSYVNDPVSTDPKDTAHFMLTPDQVAANEAGPEETAEMDAPVFSDDELLIPETDLEETELDLDFPAGPWNEAEMIDCPPLGDNPQWKTDFGPGPTLCDPMTSRDVLGVRLAAEELTAAALEDAAKILDDSGIVFIGDYDDAAAQPRTAMHQGVPVDPAENTAPIKQLAEYAPGTMTQADVHAAVGYQDVKTKAESLRDILDAEEAKPIESCNLQAFCQKMKEKVAAKNQVAYERALEDLDNAPTTQAAVSALTTIIRLLKGN